MWLWINCVWCVMCVWVRQLSTESMLLCVLAIKCAAVNDECFHVLTSLYIHSIIIVFYFISSFFSSYNRNVWLCDSFWAPIHIFNGNLIVFIHIQNGYEPPPYINSMYKKSVFFVEMALILLLPLAPDSVLLRALLLFRSFRTQ